MASRRRYVGQVAVVTGAASGIGRALAAALAAEGAHVVCADLDAAGAQAAAAAIAAGGVFGAGLEGRALDVTCADAFQHLVDEVVGARGRIDILCNNAGVGLAGEVRDTRVADWRRLIDVNVMGVVHGVAAAYPGMVERGRGTIINTASGAGLMPRPGMAAYAATKHAVVGLTTSLWAEARALGVGVYAACPGYVATAIQGSTPFRHLDKDALLAGIPLRPMSAERCARAILRGARRGGPIIPVTGVIRLEWLLWRLVPWALLPVLRWRAAQFRRHRRPSTP